MTNPKSTSDGINAPDIHAWLETVATSGKTNAARLRYRNGHAAQAIQLLTHHVKDHPNDGRSWEMLGAMYYRTGQIRLAVDALETASLLIPLSQFAQFVLADAYLSTDMTQTASQMFEYLMSQNPPSDLIPWIVDRLEKVGLPFHALELCREAAARNPNCDETLFALAQHLCRCGYPPNLVLPVLRRAVELDPRNPLYRVALAKFAVQVGEVEIARQAIRNLDANAFQDIRRCSPLLRFEQRYCVPQIEANRSTTDESLRRTIQQEREAS